MSSQQQRFLTVIVPPGIIPGVGYLQVRDDQGRFYSCQVPIGVYPGQAFVISVNDDDGSSTSAAPAVVPQQITQGGWLHNPVLSTTPSNVSGGVLFGNAVTKSKMKFLYCVIIRFIGSDKCGLQNYKT
jgi:hypothetical protein